MFIKFKVHLARSEDIFLSEVSHAIDEKMRTNDVTHTNFICKAVETTEIFLKNSIPRSQVARIIDGDDELQKHHRTSPDVQFNEFSLSKQKLDLERTMSELGEQFSKNQIENLTENQCQNDACEQKSPSEIEKFGSNKKLGLK